MLRNILALLALSAGLTAQENIPVESLTFAGSYDVATQTFTPARADEVAAYQADPEVLFNNTSTNGSLFTYDGSFAGQHIMDWGTANFGGSGAVIDSIQIGYATSALAPVDVGLRIRLHQGATGFGVPGTIIDDFSLTGLPNSASGGFEGFFINVTLAAPLPMDDGAIGWSYTTDTAGTGPLTCGPPNPAGVVDALDQYLVVDDSYFNTFFFGGAPFASTYMQLTGRANFTPPSAWEKYGLKNKVEVNGFGPGTPGSQATFTTKPNNSVGKPMVFMVGINQSDLYVPQLDLQFYAWPWVFMSPQYTPNPGNPITEFPFEVPTFLSPGDEFFFQAFSQNLGNEWTFYSKGLKLTIQ